MADITLYHSPASRAFVTYWLLEELGTPFNVRTIDLRKGEQKSAEYRRINPMGKVPALTDGKVTVTENPAICLYLADRYGYGRLAPKIGAPERGAYLRWMVFSTAVLEPAANLKSVEAHQPGFGAGWGDLATVIETVESAVGEGPWLLGQTFSAADVMLGSVISMALFNKLLPESDPIEAYQQRLAARPAYQRASDATWPASLFGAG
jgi:glutathione S-transferase